MRAPNLVEQCTFNVTGNSHPDIIRLAKLHRSLAIEKGYEVEIFTCLKEGFAWLGFENPEPDIIKQ
ncbi:MAG: hypothetical protein IMF15_02210 [Proteobacteria bacterium]|nr:hypothetical protein [Pseudomonadota bacterium]